ncbi:class I SAM-dependent methyltransferase [Patescibacteria group bacterium]|nr:class I SAM-dependent methyltransferase [Patescibacteria group bacterium]MBU1953031.1 class I SAM-dependent methyltransferase [Patescibacteria group bacterium]
MIIKSETLINKIYFPEAIIKEGIAKGSSVLDIGCATGSFLKCCDDFGLKTWGIDISEEYLDEAKKVTKAQLTKHDCDKGLGIFANDTFSFISAFDVIEHLESPVGFLRECRRILKPNGKLLLTTPNLNSLGRFLSGKSWHGYGDKTHKYLFTSKSLEFILEVAGFKVVKATAPFHPLPKVVQLFVNNLGLGGQLWMVSQK